MPTTCRAEVCEGGLVGIHQVGFNPLAGGVSPLVVKKIKIPVLFGERLQPLVPISCASCVSWLTPIA